MSQVWVPLLSALFGAVVGSLTTIASIFVQTQAERKRERVRLAVQAAIQEQATASAHAKPGTIMYPLSTFIHFHMRFLELLDQGRLTVATLRQLLKERDEIMKVSDEDQIRPT